MLYDTRLGFAAFVLAGVFAGLVFVSDSSSTAHNAWSAAGCFAVAALANMIVPWFEGRAHRKAVEAGWVHEA